MEKRSFNLLISLLDRSLFYINTLSISIIIIIIIIIIIYIQIIIYRSISYIRAN